MPAERGGMGGHGGAVTGQGKAGCINQAKPYRREYGKDGKYPLQGCLGIVRGGFSAGDTANNVPGGGSAWIFRFFQLAVGADDLFGLLSVFAGREQEGAGIGIPRAKPETVHKIIVRTEGRKFPGGRAADEDGQGNGTGKHVPDP
jgi:hypothetical protein